VAGLFYPADALQLGQQVDRFLSAASRGSGPVPKALIVPHAGYDYSGPIAGSGYAQLGSARNRIQRVVLLGPAHFVPVASLAASSHSWFQSPLGDVPVDTGSLQSILDRPGVSIVDQAHSREHSLEVQLPFLQQTLEAVHLIPLLVGQAVVDDVAAVIEVLWGGNETLVVVSSDLSHFLDYESAQRRDRRTADRIERLEGDELTGEDACGSLPIRGLLEVARGKGLRAQTLDLRNSGDTAGQKDQVVGYGAFALYAA
jgi:AmmeMemoRadiSam system protein B